MNLAQELSLSVYDSSYLALYLAEGVPLVTLDARLADAARGVGISLLS
ncbi:MAG: type II toxin-antitoxin system VapC family toxin [Actinobacteria bacterium]|nr:type II toxin-antitoxin system VapC family toxin [Actinomycetota bacterium]